MTMGFWFGGYTLERIHKIKDYGWSLAFDLVDIGKNLETHGRDRIKDGHWLLAWRILERIPKGTFLYILASMGSKYNFEK